MRVLASLLLAVCALGCAAEASAPAIAESSEEQAQITLKRAYAIAISADDDPAAPAELNARWIGWVGVTNDAATRFHVQPCAVVAPKSGARPLVPDRVLESIRPMEVSGRLDADTLEVEEVAMLFGVRGLANPAMDPLPASEDDARVCDHDGDGLPGFRVETAEGPANIGMRILVGLRGSVDPASGTVSGEARIRVESRTYGASSYYAAARGPDVSKDAKAVRRFKLVPLPGCAHVSQRSGDGGRRGARGFARLNADRFPRRAWNAYDESMRRILASACAAAIALASATALSNSDGRSGSSGSNGGTCNSCHNGGVPPSVIEIVGPTTLDAGATAIYTLRFETDAAVTGCGVGVDDLAAALGAQPDGGTQTRGTDVTHRAPTPPVAGEARYGFTLTAPPYGGTIVVYAAGNACNGDGLRTGDRAAATQLQVTVLGPPRPVFEGGSSPADASPADEAGAGPGEPPDAGSPSADVGAPPAAAPSAGGCATASSEASAGSCVLVLASLAWWRAKRRAGARDDELRRRR